MSAKVSTFGHRGTTSSVKTEIVRELVNASDGAGLHFDGAAGNIDIASPPDLGTAFSFEFVIKADEWGTDAGYFLDFSTGGRFIFGTTSSQSYNISIYDNSAWGNFGVKVLDDLKVHHLVVTVDGTAATLYDNGNQVGTLTISGSHGIDSCSDLAIGPGGTGTPMTFYRTRFYNKALTSAEVQTAYERADVPVADQYGSQTELSSASFTNSGFAGYSGSATGFTATGSANGNIGYKNQTFTDGKKFRIKFTVTDGESSNLYFNFRTSSAGGGSNTGNITSSSKGIATTNALQVTQTGDYEVIVDSLGSAASYRFVAAADVGAVNISGFSIVQIGAVVDLDLAFASPTQSRTVQDRAGVADGTCSASGVSQVQPVVQVNATSARIGTSTLQPADGELMVDSVDVRNGNVRVIGGNQVQLLNAANDTNADIINSGGSGVAQLGLRVAGSEKVTISSSGNITTASDGIALKLDGSSNTTRGIFIRNTGGSAHGYLHTDGNLKIIAEDAGKSISFYTVNDGSGTARLTIDANGKTTATATTTDSSGLVDTLHIKNGGTQVGDGGKLLFTAGTSTNGAGIGSTGQALNSADLKFYTGGSNERLHIHHSTGLCTFSSGIAQGGTSGNEQANIDTSGVLRIRRDSGAVRDNVTFTNGGSLVGSITSSTSATQYNTSSDYRLKENLEPLTGALDRIDQLPVYRFNFTTDPDTTVDGFIAHEVSEHVPEAITGEKDAMKTIVVQEAVEAVEAQPATYWEEGDELPEGVAIGDEKTPAVEAVEAVEEVTEEQPDYQGIDQSKLVPLLVAAVKELKAKVETLENS